MKWYGHPIRTLTRTEVALVYVGDEGAGKGTVTEFFREHVYGCRLAKNYGELSELDTNFNITLRGRMMVIVEEIKTNQAMFGKI